VIIPNAVNITEVFQKFKGWVKTKKEANTGYLLVTRPTSSEREMREEYESFFSYGSTAP
jgi:hypothetical protein